ncbi:hypothetical protein [Nostoc sp.]|uniref:hypothetical protein n=1 Tax=Nostoc sp. TaxID=1180 RepID=UPI002FF7A7DD
MSYANAPREKLAIAFQLINLRSLPASGYAIATDFLRLGRLVVIFSSVQYLMSATPTTKPMLSFN